MASVLLIEDDAALGPLLRRQLAGEGFRVEWVRTARDARARFAADTWDLAIVDVKLPDGSGFGLAREFRRRSTVSIMFMSGLTSAENRLEGFEIGADEYLPKPFHPKEFILRVRNVLGRQRAGRIVHAGGCAIDLSAMTVCRGTTCVPLQPRDCQVLKLLIASAPRVVPRSEILDRVWGEQSTPAPRSVDNAIVRLRQALDDARLIRSVRGIGYQWAGDDR